MPVDTYYRWRDRISCHRTCVFVNVGIITTCTALYGLNRWVFIPFLKWPFLSWYLNDLLAMPWLLAYSNLLIWVSGLRRLALVSVWRILAVGVLVGCFWEYAGPLLNPRSVTDEWDLLAYLGGAILYRAILKYHGFDQGQPWIRSDQSTRNAILN